MRIFLKIFIGIFFAIFLSNSFAANPVSQSYVDKKAADLQAQIDAIKPAEGGHLLKLEIQRVTESCII